MVELWEKVLEAVEGGKNAAVLLGVDFEKAFNRMEHAECLKQLERLGASSGSLGLVHAFLKNRRMTMLLNGHCAEEIEIRRGSPQGSVLGCLLYCITTQRLTDDLEHPTPLVTGNDLTDTTLAPLPTRPLGAPPRPAAVPGEGIPPVYFPQDDSDDSDANFWDAPEEGLATMVSPSPRSNTSTIQRSSRRPRLTKRCGMFRELPHVNPDVTQAGSLPSATCQGNPRILA